MEVRLLSEKDGSRWDRLVEKHLLGSVEQSLAWGELQTCVPGRSAFRVFGVFEWEELVGGMLVIRQVMGLGKTWLWCPKGPLLPKEGAEEAWELLEKAVECLGEGDVFLRVESCYGEDSVIRGEEVKARYIPSNTLVLDLSLPEEKLLVEMSQGTRRNIRISEKAGVKVRSGDLEEIGKFYEILKDTAARDRFHLHDEHFYKNFLKLLRDRARFWLAEINGEMVGGALVVHFADTMTYYFGASSNESREAKVGHALQWHAIQEARRAGAKSYDFLGIAQEGDAADSLAKVTQFKLGFGGKRVVYQKSQVLVYRPFWWFVYRLAKLFR